MFVVKCMSHGMNIVYHYFNPLEVCTFHCWKSLKNNVGESKKFFFTAIRGRKKRDTSTKRKKSRLSEHESVYTSLNSTIQCRIRLSKQRDNGGAGWNRRGGKTGQISRQRESNEAYNNPRWHSNKQPSVANTPVVCNAPKTAPRKEITMTMSEIRSACGHPL